MDMLTSHTYIKYSSEDNHPHERHTAEMESVSSVPVHLYRNSISPIDRPVLSCMWDKGKVCRQGLECSF